MQFDRDFFYMSKRWFITVLDHACQLKTPEDEEWSNWRGNFQDSQQECSAAVYFLKKMGKKKQGASAIRSSRCFLLNQVPNNMNNAFKSAGKWWVQLGPRVQCRRERTEFMVRWE